MKIISLLQKLFSMECAILILLISFSFTKADGQASNESTKKANDLSKPPNIALIISDQFRDDACKREGFPLNTTPFLDSLAETGMWFNKK